MKKMNKTIIYYTSNHEDPLFEQKIIQHLLANKGDLPIISVSQKPMDLGQNICVGDIGLSYLSEYKQILAGCKLAKTDYVITAESDYLYAPDYFQLVPAGENIYRYDDIWIMWLFDKKGSFHRKAKYSEGAQIVKRDYFIKILEKYVNHPDPNHSPYYKQPWSYLHGENPCISFKTGNGVGKHTGIRYEPENVRKDLPYWGNIDKLRQEFI
jgi:hypothetical protein